MFLGVISLTMTLQKRPSTWKQRTLHSRSKKSHKISCEHQNDFSLSRNFLLHYFIPKEFIFCKFWISIYHFRVLNMLFLQIQLSYYPNVYRGTQSYLRVWNQTLKHLVCKKVMLHYQLSLKKRILKQLGVSIIYHGRFISLLQ